jgi:hypothetical protein
MKRLVRSILDPSPRTVSVKSLALLVGGLLCGIGISVHEYLQSGRPVVRASSSAPAEQGSCRREACRSTCTVPAPIGDLPRSAVPSLQDPRPAVRDPQPASAKRAAASVPSAPTQWTPDEGSGSDLRDEASSGASQETSFGRSGRVSTQ